MNIFKITCVSHELSWNLLIAAPSAEDLATNTPVVTSTECGELLTTFIAFFALTIRHPVLLEITISVVLRNLRVEEVEGDKSVKGCQRVSKGVKGCHGL